MYSGYILKNSKNIYFIYFSIGYRGPSCGLTCWGDTGLKNCQNCNCQNNGSCDPFTNKCRCSAGWTGNSCEVPCAHSTYGLGWFSSKQNIMSLIGFKLATIQITIYYISTKDRGRKNFTEEGRGDIKIVKVKIL